MSRINNWNALQTNVMYQSAFKKLSAKEKELCHGFLFDNESLTQSEFAEKLNRWYLDKPEKPKHLNAMWALLTAANPSLKGRW